MADLETFGQWVKRNTRLKRVHDLKVHSPPVRRFSEP